MFLGKSRVKLICTWSNNFVTSAIKVFLECFTNSQLRHDSCIQRTDDEKFTLNAKIVFAIKSVATQPYQRSKVHIMNTFSLLLISYLATVCSCNLVIRGPDTFCNDDGKGFVQLMLDELLHHQMCDKLSKERSLEGKVWVIQLIEVPNIIDDLQLALSRLPILSPLRNMSLPDLLRRHDLSYFANGPQITRKRNLIL